MADVRLLAAATPGKFNSGEAGKEAFDRRLDAGAGSRIRQSSNAAIVLRSPAGWELHLPIAVDTVWFTEVLKRLP